MVDDGETLFCPDGYVPVRRAIERAVLDWFPEQVSAIDTAVAGDLAGDGKPNVAMTPNEQLRRAVEGQPSISEGLRQQIENVLTQTEYRLRNFLHQGVLSAHYFGGLFDQGRQTVTPEFWAITEADGVLLSGTYWPFGRPRTRYEQKPNYSLFFLESELTALLSKSAIDPVDIRKQAHPLNKGVTDQPSIEVHRAETAESTAAKPSKLSSSFQLDKNRSAQPGRYPHVREMAAETLRQRLRSKALTEEDIGGRLTKEKLAQKLCCARTELNKVFEIVLAESDFKRFQGPWRKRNEARPRPVRE